MKILDRALGAIGLERRSTNPNDTWGAFSALRTGSVTPDSAQSVAACYAAVGAIAEAIGSLPLHLYRRDGDSRTKATDHALYATLHHAPNEHQSAPEFREWMTAAMLLTGNAYARITRGWDGQARALDPLVTDRVTVLRKGEAIGGYEYTDRDGKRERLLPSEVFHLRHRAGNDPLIGQSPITAARAVIQLAQAEAQHGQSTFDNGTRASGILSMPGRLKPEQRQAIAQSWQSQYAGGSNAGKVPVLEEGTTFTPISLSLADSDWVAARRFSVEEVARLFKIPSVMLGDLTHANYSNSSEMFRWFVVHTLKRHMAAWEGAITRQLLTPAGARLYYPEFNAEGMLRGDHASRAAFYSSGIASGWMLPSEARRLENLPTIEGIDDAPRDGQAVPARQPYPSKE